MSVMGKARSMLPCARLTSIAVLASAAASRTDSLTSAGHDALSALNGGYHLAFMIGAAFAVAAMVVAAVLIRAEAPAAMHAATAVEAE